MKQVANSLTELHQKVEDSLYRPTAEEMAWKAKFWETSPSLSIELNGNDFARIVGVQKIKQSCAKPGFNDWFLNRDDYKWRIQYLFMRSVAALEEIIENNDPKAQSARVNAVKLLVELAGKTPKQLAATGMDEIAKQIGSMDKVQLDAFLEKEGANLHVRATGTNRNLQEPTVVDIPKGK